MQQAALNTAEMGLNLSRERNVTKHVWYCTAHEVSSLFEFYFLNAVGCRLDLKADQSLYNNCVHIWEHVPYGSR